MKADVFPYRACWGAALNAAEWRQQRGNPEFLSYLERVHGMDDSFIINVEVEGKEYSFEARLATVGYTHKFFVVINGMEVIYEPDEERNYRAILSEADHAKVKGSDIELIKAVGDKIQAS